MTILTFSLRLDSVQAQLSTCVSQARETRVSHGLSRRTVIGQRRHSRPLCQGSVARVSRPCAGRAMQMTSLRYACRCNPSCLTHRVFVDTAEIQCLHTHMVVLKDSKARASFLLASVIPGNFRPSDPGAHRPNFVLDPSITLRFHLPYS